MIVIFVVVVLNAVCFVRAESAPTERRPNILVLIADDLGVGDIGFSGSSDVPTPHLDGLAKDGVILRHGYVFPMCAPTRAAFLTGRNPAAIGFEDNRPGDTRHFGMDLSLPTLAETLREGGYVTGLVGKWHLGRGLNNEYSPWNRGFDEFLGYYGAFGTYVNPKLTTPPGVEKVVEGYSTEIFADAACDFLRRHKDRPFFLNVAFNAAHLKQVAKREDLAKFQHIKNPKRRTAAAIIANLDANIGRIVSQLKALDLDRNTLLVFFSDNGGEPPILATFNGPHRGMKFDLYEGGIRVPFFVRWPDGLPSGKTFDAPVSVVDLLPTISAAANLKAPKKSDGVDLLPFLSGKKSKAPHEALFWRTTEHAALQKMRQRPNSNPPIYVPHLAAVRQDRWKLVVFDDAGEQRRVELYDVISDPAEQSNLAEQQPRILKQMLNKLESWKRTLKPQLVPPLKKS